MKHYITLISFLFLFTLQLLAQTIFPENGELYVDTTVPRIDITVHPDTLAWLYEWDNLESDIEYTAAFVFDNGHVRDSIYPVGFRLRGNTSRYSQKKSFKVSFNRFTSGGKYYGVEKLNLNGEHNDPSVIRACTSTWNILMRSSSKPGLHIMTAIYTSASTLPTSIIWDQTPICINSNQATGGYTN